MIAEKDALTQDVNQTLVKLFMNDGLASKSDMTGLGDVGGNSERISVVGTGQGWPYN